jgi:hypothetical protein
MPRRAVARLCGPQNRAIRGSGGDGSRHRSEVTPTGPAVGTRPRPVAAGGPALAPRFASPVGVAAPRRGRAVSGSVGTPPMRGRNWPTRTARAEPAPTRAEHGATGPDTGSPDGACR